MKGFTEEQRMKLATVYAMIFANSKLLTFTRTEKIEKTIKFFVFVGHRIYKQCIIHFTVV